MVKIRDFYKSLSFMSLIICSLLASIAMPTTLGNEYVHPNSQRQKESSRIIGDFEIDVKVSNTRVRGESEINQNDLSLTNELSIGEKSSESEVDLSVHESKRMDNLKSTESFKFIDESTFSSLIDDGVFKFHSSPTVSKPRKKRLISDSVNLKKRVDVVRGKRSFPHLQHEVTISLKQKNIDKLQDLLLAVSMPESHQYGQHWSIEQVRQLTTDESAFISIENYFKSYSKINRKSLEIVHVSPFREFIVVRACISVWEEILDTEFYDFHSVKNKDRYNQDNTDTYIVRALDYSLPVELRSHVMALLNVVDVFDALRLTSASVQSVLDQKIGLQSVDPDDTITPTVLRSEYNINDAMTALFSSQAIFARGDSNLIAMSDLQQFHSQFSPNTTPFSLKGVSLSSQVSQCNSGSECESSTMAIEYITAIAKSASTSYYLSSNFSISNNKTFSVTSFWNSWLLSISSMTSLPDVIYLDYYDEEQNVQPAVANIFNIEAMKLGIAGVTIIVSSGTDGASNGACCSFSPIFPATSPFVTAVGSTQGLHSAKNEKVSTRNLNGAGITSGGGFSSLFSQPSWQKSEVANYLEQHCLLAPTSSPSAIPTAFPSQTPSEVPSLSPIVKPTVLPTTASPSAYPSVVPTANPTTANPSIDPTLFPTPVPSVFPSIAPSASPSEEPTPAPSVSPTTASPTASPTSGPTAAPSTALPTATPTITPSAFPTEEPSFSPSTIPTLKPTGSPTAKPSASPSESPTIAPSVAPTIPPTLAPTASPTEEPTTAPSVSPTISPTGSPTEEPTIGPSNSPSFVPSVSPTCSPSDAPSVAPTAAPSASPTDTLLPTVSPTEEPTASPTPGPTAGPTVIPTFAPTLSPSFLPTVTPSFSPSDAPTDEPSAAPTVPSTLSPSIMPSQCPSGAPSDVPTFVSSSAPTEESITSTGPTLSPTAPPTLMPTATPSFLLSATVFPTVAPTVLPSEVPTAIPTASPTILLAPTDEFQANPTVEPTAEPTIEEIHSIQSLHRVIGILPSFSLLENHDRSEIEEVSSTSHVIPSIHIHTTAVNPTQACSYDFVSTGRGYPDVSLLSGKYTIVLNGQMQNSFGAGRQSAAVFAGMVTLMNSARLSKGMKRLGWINPALYHYSDRFVNDIIEGDNYQASTKGFFAVPGWDAASGLGSVNFTSMFNVFTMNESTGSLATAYPSVVPTLSPTTAGPTIAPTTSPTTASPSISPTYQVVPVVSFQSILQVTRVREFQSTWRINKGAVKTAVVEAQAQILNISSRYIQYIDYENVTSQSSSRRQLRSILSKNVVTVSAANSSATTTTIAIKFITEIVLPLVNFPLYGSNSSKLLQDVTTKLSKAAASGDLINALRSVAGSLNLTNFENATVTSLEIGTVSIIQPPTFSPTSPPSHVFSRDDSVVFSQGEVAGLVIAGFVVIGACMGYIYFYILKKINPKPKRVVSARIHRSYSPSHWNSIEGDNNREEGDGETSEQDENAVALRAVNVQLMDAPLDVRMPPRPRINDRSNNNSPPPGTQPNGSRKPKHRLDDRWIIARYGDEVTL